MTFPTIPQAGPAFIVGNNQLNTTATRTFPAFSTLNYAAGDLLIAVVTGYQSSTTPAFSAWSNSFTEFTDQGTGTTTSIGAAYKFTSGGETGSLTVTQAATITGDASMILMAIRCAHSSTPPEASTMVSAAGTGDVGSFDPAGWGAEDTLWICVNANGMTSATGTWTANNGPPTNYVEYFGTNPADTSTIGDVGLAVAFRQTNASSEDAGTFNQDTSNARNSTLTIAVRGATAPPDVPLNMIRKLY